MQNSKKEEKRIFFSMSMRFRVPVEHANMIGTIVSSNITKHRFIYVPVPIEENGKITRYRLVRAPAISGQALLNAYERALVDYSLKLEEKLQERFRSKEIKIIDDYCRQYVFIKHAKSEKDKDSNDKSENKNKKDDKTKSEQDWIRECYVEDITGYLAPDANARKTSTIWFSYVVPDFTISKALLDYQIFARYALEQTREKGGFIGERESGHAVYRLSIAIDASRIGYDGKGNLVINNEEERACRVEAAFKALMLMLSGGYIGANRTRALMLEYVKPTSLVAAVSVGLPFMVSPAEGTDYIVKTCSRATTFVNDLGAEVYLYYLAGDADKPSQCSEKDKLSSESVDSLESAIDKAMNKVLEKLGLNNKCKAQEYA